MQEFSSHEFWNRAHDFDFAALLLRMPVIFWFQGPGVFVHTDCLVGLGICLVINTLSQCDCISASRFDS